MNFSCPNCKGSSLNKEDDKFFSASRIQGSDALNADPLSNITTKIELWYCCFCGKYFKVYYTLNKINWLDERESPNKRELSGPIEQTSASACSL